MEWEIVFIETFLTVVIIFFSLSIKLGVLQALLLLAAESLSLRIWGFEVVGLIG